VGYDGVSLRAEYYSPDGRWFPLRLNGIAVEDDFPSADTLARGVRADGTVVEAPSQLDAGALSAVLHQLKTVYRGIPALKSGRRPIDFTVALLTLRLLVERKREWGSWAEQPSLAPDAPTLDHQVAERFRVLVVRCMESQPLRESYGSIFKFSEYDEAESEIAFDFEAVLKAIATGRGFFSRIFELIDTLPTLHGADIDIFGEVYQTIGEDAVKRAFGEYFTPRHIISGVLPVLFARASADSYEAFKGKRFVDITCGTGGFLTGTLRYVRQAFSLDREEVTAFASESFYGYDLSASNASRARVNMYFAGDGFSVIQGGVNSLNRDDPKGPHDLKFDFLLTNPPYGSSSENRLLHERFLARAAQVLKESTGWGVVVMPAGSLENPRSATARLELLKNAQVTDVIALPRHAFAPYTVQRTAILVFRKRPTPVAAVTWDELLGHIGIEKVSMFIVDNDGFANSDKRFPTRRKAPDGSWVHDDLSPWTDVYGARKHSKIFTALINETAPDGDGNRQYGRYSLSELRKMMASWGADRGSGVELLPDSFLRPPAPGMSMEDFITRGTDLLHQVSQSCPRPISGDLAHLLASPIVLADSEQEPRRIDAMFEFHKGDTNLTEAAIYTAYDPVGIPVYGGGASLPAHHIRRDAKTSKNKAVTIFSAPAIVLSLDGSSGSMQIVETGDFACNHHAAVLNPLTADLNLYVIAQQAEGRLRALASNRESSATLTKGTVNSLTISVPQGNAVSKQIGDMRKKLTNLRFMLT
jgi:hypothetical protein